MYFLGLLSSEKNGGLEAQMGDRHEHQWSFGNVLLSVHVVN